MERIVRKIKNKILIIIEKALSTQLNKIRVKIFSTSNLSNLKLVDLTPNDNAIENETYFHAISDALKNKK